MRERSRVYDAELHAFVGELCYPVDNLAFVVRLEIDDFRAEFSGFRLERGDDVCESGRAVYFRLADSEPVEVYAVDYCYFFQLKCLKVSSNFHNYN